MMDEQVQEEIVDDEIIEVVESSDNQSLLLEVISNQQQQIQQLEDIKNYSENLFGVVFFAVVIMVCVWIANRVTDLFQGVFR